MGRGGGEERKRKKKKKTPAKSTVLQCQVYGAVGIGMYGTCIIRYFCMSGYTLLLSARVGVALSVTRCMMVSIHPSRHAGM